MGAQESSLPENPTSPQGLKVEYEERAAALNPLYSTSLQGLKVEYEERAAVLTPLHSATGGSEEVGSTLKGRVVEDETEPQSLPTSKGEPGSKFSLHQQGRNMFAWCAHPVGCPADAGTEGIPDEEAPQGCLPQGLGGPGVQP